jgi:hypothetical protein
MVILSDTAATVKDPVFFVVVNAPPPETLAGTLTSWPTFAVTFPVTVIAG